MAKFVRCLGVLKRAAVAAFGDIFVKDAWALENVIGTLGWLSRIVFGMFGQNPNEARFSGEIS
jgi:hypothetical protein